MWTLKSDNSNNIAKVLIYWWGVNPANIESISVHLSHVDVQAWSLILWELHSKTQIDVQNLLDFISRSEWLKYTKNELVSLLLSLPWWFQLKDKLIQGDPIV